MLIVEFKSKEDIASLSGGQTFIISCTGCSEVYFPETGVSEICKELSASMDILDVVNIDCICNPDKLLLHLNKHSDVMGKSNSVLVFSCGVGVQTISANCTGKQVFAGCDTYPLPGFQGLTPLEFDCVGCSCCHLNNTYGICPITTCSKSLINGQCGGSKNGKCEADSDMECGWEKIYSRAKMVSL